MGNAGSGVQIKPKIQDFMDSRLDLSHAQLLGGGAVGATWPYIQPHLGLSPLERLDSAAEKRPQEVCPC
jgi:hypothetical protein